MAGNILNTKAPFLMDSREPKRIIYELTRRGIPVERALLEVGDYSFADVGIERKTVKDFLNSIYYHRLFDQLFNLSHSYERPLLVVIGAFPEVKWIRTATRAFPQPLTHKEKEDRKKTIRANLVTAYLSYRVPFYFARTEEEFLDFLTDCYFKRTKKVPSLKPVKRKKESLFEIKSDMLSCVPLLGRKYANELAKDYSIRELANSDKESLKVVKGMGNKRTDSLLKVLTE